MQRIAVNLTNDSDGNRLKYNNDVLAIGNKIYALQKCFETDFLTFVICWVAQGSRLRCGPRHTILHSNIFFHVKLFGKIILSWNSIKCIFWYLLELSDPFIKNENSVLPILIAKNFEQKIYFCLFKTSFFFKRREIQFFLLNLGRDYRNHFLNFM